MERKRYNPVAVWEDREMDSAEARVDAQYELHWNEACRIGNHDFRCACGCGEPLDLELAASWGDGACRWCGIEYKNTGLAYPFKAEVPYGHRAVDYKVYDPYDGLSWEAPRY